jgi:hypothetical protein
MKTSFYMAKSFFPYRILAKTVANKETKSSATLRGRTQKSSARWVLVTTLREREARIGNCIAGLVASKL